MESQYFSVQTEQARLIRDLLYGFVGLQFVVTLLKRPKNASAAKHSAVFIWVICLFRIVKLTRGVIFVVIIRHNKFQFRLKFYLCNVYTSEQDEFLEMARRLF